MQDTPHPLENLRLEDLRVSSSKREQTAWSAQSSTLYAHPSGKLPSRFAAVGWQPWHRPGGSGTALVSTTVAALTRRSQRTVRGEA